MEHMMAEYSVFEAYRFADFHPKTPGSILDAERC